MSKRRVIFTLAGVNFKTGLKGAVEMGVQNGALSLIGVSISHKFCYIKGLEQKEKADPLPDQPFKKKIILTGAV